jgi:hypothetical protein
VSRFVVAALAIDRFREPACDRGQDAPLTQTVEHAIATAQFSLSSLRIAGKQLDVSRNE